jgi:hypothetical protein
MMVPRKKKSESTGGSEADLGLYNNSKVTNLNVIISAQLFVRMFTSMSAALSSWVGV